MADDLRIGTGIALAHITHSRAYPEATVSQNFQFGVRIIGDNRSKPNAVASRGDTDAAALKRRSAGNPLITPQPQGMVRHFFQAFGKTRSPRQKNSGGRAIPAADRIFSSQFQGLKAARFRQFIHRLFHGSGDLRHPEPAKSA